MNNAWTSEDHTVYVITVGERLRPAGARSRPVHRLFLELEAVEREAGAVQEVAQPPTPGGTWGALCVQPTVHLMVTR